MKIYYDVTLEELKDFLKYKTWAGAKQRVENMSETELDMLAQYIFDFADESENKLSETDINDIVWFDWDEIKENVLPF